MTGIIQVGFPLPGKPFAQAVRHWIISTVTMRENPYPLALSNDRTVEAIAPNSSSQWGNLKHTQWLVISRRKQRIHRSWANNPIHA